MHVYLVTSVRLDGLRLEHPPTFERAIATRFAADLAALEGVGVAHPTLLATITRVQTRCRVEAVWMGSHLLIAVERWPVVGTPESDEPT